MRRSLFVFLCLVFLTVSCTRQFAPLPTAALTSVSPTPNISPPTHAPDIRFALIGEPRDMNVWALFDEQGTSYADYALRANYFPRLYHLVPPDFSFQPLAAQDFPSSVIQEGEFYSATVMLRPDLKWTDGSPFTTDDIAFTVNTALGFELGLDWRASYSYDFLDRAEVVDPYTIKFFFNQKPHVGLWQYGVLQGPIVQKSFWQPRIAKAEELLPDATSRNETDKARAYLARVQRDVNDLTAQLIAARQVGRGERDIEIPLTQRNLELGYAKNNLNKALERYETKIIAARQSLYSLDDANEPTLGAWHFESKTGNIWVNAANPDFPFGKPNFDRALYYIFKDEKDALAAFESNEVDLVLSQNGVPRDVKNAQINATYSARFLVLNPLKAQFADPILHSALSCMIDRKELAQNILQRNAAPLDAFVLSPQWHDVNVKEPCSGMDRAARIEYVVNLLADAGYSWTQKPDMANAGRNLIMPDGTAFPKLILSAPSYNADPLRYAAAKYIAEQVQYLGIPFAVNEMSVDDVVYAVYSSQKYDAALVGWRLSEYPAYLCEWFGGRNQYLYRGGRFTLTCNALENETDLEAARQFVRQFEAELMSELPFIPLFTMTQAEVYRNLTYPAQGILNGWGSLYGAPSYAVPSP
jgi:ABC-type transport system substrate-binding protein